MKNKILWIDDDYYAIQGLFRPIEKENYEVDMALSALEGYQKAQKWHDYDLIVVDLILPVSQEDTAPELVRSWDDQEKYAYVGIGLVEWLLKDIKVNCPVVILSVVPDPITTYKLESLGVSDYIRKSGLLPTSLKDELMPILEK
jgi:CheY-like chemotaxis protein